MESTFNNFESAANATQFEDQQSGFAVQTLDFPGGEDEDGGDEEDDEDKSNVPNNDNPPLDGDVVHSPVNPQPGGKPKSS